MLDLLILGGVAWLLLEDPKRRAAATKATRAIADWVRKVSR